MKSIPICMAFLLAPALVLCVTLSATAESSKQNPDTVKLDAGANGKTIPLKLGSSLEISLSGNPTTGYSWKLDSISGAALKQVGKLDYVADEHAEKRVGSGGTFVARFKAVAPGESTVNLLYARPWEKGKPPAQTFSTKVQVTQ